MKQKKTAYVGFRVEEDILEKFDQIVEELGLKRQDLLRNFMRAFVGEYGEAVVDALEVVNLMKRFDELQADAKKLYENMKAVMLQDIILREKYGGVEYDKSADDS